MNERKNPVGTNHELVIKRILLLSHWGEIGGNCSEREKTTI